MELTGTEARVFWKALIDNASALIVDAHILLEAKSCGRARSLTVLAWEELGKALWVYEVFEQAWNSGDDSRRRVDALVKHGRDHTGKYLEAVHFGREVAVFWGDTEAMEWQHEDETVDDALARHRQSAGEAARDANTAKKRGFYVDRDEDGTTHLPTEVDAGTIPDDLRTAAQVVEMLLIKDHSRMKHNASIPYDSTHEQQFRLLPISHPEDWAAAPDSFRAGGGGSGLPG